MSGIQQRRASRWDRHDEARVIAMAAAQEGVRRALLGSFGSIPAMPEEFVRLLDRIA
ncbi:MAG TPA: hypothetical protein VNT42_09990 [Sphingomonas sp.]|nr:hypothetical protein [Sphingomonas sp.]